MMTIKIGALSLNNNLFLAPLAGISTLPFRLMLREFGVGLAFTEMVSAEGLIRGSRGTFSYLATTENDQPLGIQIFGSDPAVMADAARIVADRGVGLLDINMGCPVPKVTKTGAGAALMREPQLVGQIVKAVRRASSLPLTVKIRSGWDERKLNAVEIGLIAQENGADALTIHARSVRQGFSGQADWGVIALVKRALSIPVIGNGDVRSGQDAKKMLDLTGCDGVMIGRGALGNPWIFPDAGRAMRGEAPLFPPGTLPGAEERERVIRRHYELTREYAGSDQAIKDFRPHLLWYTKRLPGGAELRRQLSFCRGEVDMQALLSQLIHRGR